MSGGETRQLTTLDFIQSIEDMVYVADKAAAIGNMDKLDSALVFILLNVERVRADVKQMQARLEAKLTTEEIER